LAKPVTFPPGRSSRATMPLATGSATFAKIIGIVCVLPVLDQADFAGLIFFQAPLLCVMRPARAGRTCTADHIQRQERQRLPRLPTSGTHQIRTRSSGAR
jgi:hypothetical protein